MELGVLFDLGLVENHTPFRVQTDAQEVDGHLENIVFEDLRALVFGAQGVPGDDALEAAVLILEEKPIAHRPGIVSQMSRAGGPDSTEDDFFLVSAHGLDKDDRQDQNLDRPDNDLQKPDIDQAQDD